MISKKNEHSVYQLSNSNVSKTGARLSGVLCLGVAIGVIYFIKAYWDISFNNYQLIFKHNALAIFSALCFTLFIIIAGFAFLMSETKKYIDTDVHSFSLFPMVLKSIRVLVVLVIFIIPFSLLIYSNATDKIFGTFGGFVVVFFWIMIAISIFYTIKNFWQYLEFGKSTLETNQSYYQLGNTIRLKLTSEKLPENELVFSLKNIHEYWKVDSNDHSGRRSPSLIYETLFQESKPGYADRYLEFIIPKNDQVKTTHYDYSKPYYWSIEISDDLSGYFSQFIINLRD